MSLQHTPDGKTCRVVLQAVASAIKALEGPQATIKGHDITRSDDFDYIQAKRHLWAILETNGYTIDCDTNRLTRGQK